MRLQLPVPWHVPCRMLISQGEMSYYAVGSVTLPEAFSAIANEHLGAPSPLFFTCQSKLGAAKIHPHSIRCSFCGRRHVLGGGAGDESLKSDTHSLPLFHFGTLPPIPSWGSL